MTRHRSARLAVLAAAVVLTAAACGSDSNSSSTTQAPTSTVAATTAPPPTTAASATTAATPTTQPSSTTAGGTGSGAVELIDTEYGKVLGSGGMTLYMFDPDNAGAPTCTAKCLENWPALKSSGSAVSPGPGLDEDDFGEAQHPEGFAQTTYYKWPLYFFAGDTKAGDVNGQGVGGKWWVLDAEGTPIKAAGGDTAAAATTVATPAAPVAPAAGVSVELVDTRYGSVLASGGKLLYVFQPDNAGPSVCTGQCLVNWPALKADGSVAPGAGLEAGDFATAAHPEGFDQVTFSNWPLYFFAGDANPGDVNGQAVGGRWWVVGADGIPITTPAS